MKKHKFTLLLQLFCVALSASAQGTFQNLNFESANVSGYAQGPGVPITNALPGWSAYTYGNMDSDVSYNSVSLGAAAISLLGPGSPYTIVQGTYSVFLQGSSASTPSGAGIGQTSLIPVMSQSLTFWGAFAGEATFNGQVIPYITIGSIGTYSIYGGDISAYAGQTGELRFNVLPHTGGILDNIQFSTQSIPEPSIYSLLGCGVLLFGAARATFKRRQ